MILNVCVCNILLQNACKHHQTYVRTTDEHGPKMVPKPLQNRSWRGLEASWEPPLKQDASKTSFLTILAPFWDPLWDQFGFILGIMFLMFFLKWPFDGLGLHLGSQSITKMRPKRDPKPKPEFHWFCCYLQYMSHIQGC